MCAGVKIKSNRNLFLQHYVSAALVMLLLVVQVLLVQAQEITIYTIPSPKGMDWNSPRELVLSYVRNTFARSPYGKEKYPIGHMMVELKDSTRHEITGTTSVTHSGMTRKVIRKGYGLGILFEKINGKLEDKNEDLQEVYLRSQQGDVAFVTYKVNQATFNRMWQYLQEYKQRGYDKIYNGSNKPREGQGAGCSAFAQSFLEVGGLSCILPANEWAVCVFIPERLIGGSKAKTRHVQFFKLLLFNKWAKPGKPNAEELTLYEPTFFYNWILKTHANTKENPLLHNATRGKAKGLIVDCTHLAPPQEPIWLTTTSGSN